MVLSINMPIALTSNVLDYDSIKDLLATDTNCTSPAGHCFGSDGGTGIPKQLKVKEGLGGNKEVWTLDAAKTIIQSKQIYSKCQYCGKYLYAGEIQ